MTSPAAQTTFRIGLVGLDSSHTEDFLRHVNAERRHPQMCITAIFGDDRQRVAELKRQDPDLEPAPTLDALIEAVDAVIVGDRHGDLHLPHALPCLAAGRPVFVDKPLANALADAEAIVRAAEQYRTPLLSGSALRWQAETRRLKAKLAGIDGPLNLAAYGTWYPQNDYGGAIFYAIHTVELVQELLGPGWRKVSSKPGKNPLIRFRSGEHTATLEFRPLDASGSSSFGVEVTAPGVHIVQPIPLADDYMAPVVDQIAAMLRAGTSPMSRDELLAPIALMEEVDALLKADA